MPIARLFTFSRADTPGESATTYVPIVLLSRGLAFLRFYLVVRILGNVGQREFGLYNPAIELINWLVPLVMLGLADVAERYAARFEKESRLRAALRRHLFRLLIIGMVTVLVLVAASRWLIYPIFKLPNADHSPTYGILLLAACAIAILLLAFYQYLAALLRGLRAFAPAAGMELSFSLLFVLFSALAAIHGTALTLIAAYALALLVPFLYFGSILLKYLKSDHAPLAQNPDLSNHDNHFGRFAIWSLIRLQLVMSFGFFTMWSVGHLAAAAGKDPQAQTAAYSTPSRIAQQLALVAITLWASCYGLAARNWSHHQTRRAKVQLFRVGKFGAVLLTLAALFLLLTRNLFALIMPTAYSESINLLLPPMLALFLWYGLLAFASTYGDLQEAPHKGACLWAVAVAIQLALILIPNALFSSDPKQQVLMASAAGLAVSLLILAPLLLWHPFRLSATAIPLVLLSLAPISLFSPPWIVDTIAPIVLLAAIAFIFITGLLIRPVDRRAWRRYRKQRSRHGN